MELPDNIKALADECNHKHVLVVQAILSGNYPSNTKAYQSVYTEASAETARTEVSKCLALPNVKTLYDALKEAQILEGVITRSEAMKILSDMATTTIGDLVDFGSHEVGVDDDGEPIYQSTWSFKDKAKIPEHALRSISELAATPQGLKIKQHDQKAAIKQLADMMGWNAPAKLDVGRTLEIAGDILYRKK